MTPRPDSAAQSRVVPELRPAATVILLRDTRAGIETWLLRRVSQMAFAPEMSVFPGGVVDAGDGRPDIPRVGAELGSVASRFGCSVEQARAALVAAVRETFEETGVLVTSPPHSGDTAGFAALRRDVEERRVEFGAFLVESGLSVDGGLIRPWSRWITPVQEPRRFDTYFYVAALPCGAQAHADSVEATHAEWIRPADALAQHANGDRPMLPPTVLTLQELKPYSTVAEVLAASDGRQLAPIEPRIGVSEFGQRQVELPDGSVYPLPGAARPSPDPT